MILQFFFIKEREVFGKNSTELVWKNQKIKSETYILFFYTLKKFLSGINYLYY